MISVRARRSKTHEGSRANWRRRSNHREPAGAAGMIAGLSLRKRPPSTPLAVLLFFASNYQPCAFSLPRKSQDPGNVRSARTAETLAATGCSFCCSLIATHNPDPALEQRIDYHINEKIASDRASEWWISLNFRKGERGHLTRGPSCRLA